MWQEGTEIDTITLFTFQYDRYQRFGAEEYVLKNGGVLCPQPDCGMGILPMDDVCNKIACTYGCGVRKAYYSAKNICSTYPHILF